jgi:hypothetical protein
MTPCFPLAYRSIQGSLRQTESDCTALTGITGVPLEAGEQCRLLPPVNVPEKPANCRD